MKLAQRMSLLAACLALISCVTVNVYFPAQAAEAAAEKFTRDVYGAKPGTAPEAPPPETEPNSDAGAPQPGYAERLFDLVIPAAHAQQPDLNLSTPAIKALKGAMQARHKSLAPHYVSGAIGIGANGLLSVRDAAAIPLAARNSVNALVADENRDRAALYNEIAKANGHPEWVNDIRAIWARQWVSNAPGGYWYQDGSGWKQK